MRIRPTVSEYNYYSNELVRQKEEVVWYPLCNFGWNGLSDGYYLSGAFDTHKGPAYEWNGPNTRSKTENETHENEGTAGNFQYKMTAVIGIRK